MIARFGSLALDTTRRQLTRDGIEIHLTPKAYELLVLLVREAPRVISRTELHQRLWPDTFVSDAALVSLVKELRRALDDHDPAAPMIRTVHRVGYAFSHPVESREVQRPATAHWLVAADGRRLPLHEGENFIGRDPASEVWLDSAGVSRRHARITIGPSGVHLEDLGSKNGTKRSDTMVTVSVRLDDRDRLHIGPEVIVYRCSGAGMSTETQANVGDGQPDLPRAAGSREASRPAKP